MRNKKTITKTGMSLTNTSKSFRLNFRIPWDLKKKQHFTISNGTNHMNLGGREARMLKAFLDKIY